MELSAVYRSSMLYTASAVRMCQNYYITPPSKSVGGDICPAVFSIHTLSHNLYHVPPSSCFAWCVRCQWLTSLRFIDLDFITGTAEVVFGDMEWCISKSNSLVSSLIWNNYQSSFYHKWWEDNTKQKIKYKLQNLSIKLCLIKTCDSQCCISFLQPRLSFKFNLLEGHWFSHKSNFAIYIIDEDIQHNKSRISMTW